MQHLNFKKLASELRNRVFCCNLKYDRICLIQRNNPVAWLIPIESKPEVEILGFVSTQTLKEQIGFHIDWLNTAKASHQRPVAFGITGADSEHLSYLVVDSNLTQEYETKIV